MSSNNAKARKKSPPIVEVLRIFGRERGWGGGHREVNLLLITRTLKILAWNGTEWTLFVWG